MCTLPIVRCARATKRVIRVKAAFCVSLEHDINAVDTFKFV